MGKVRREGGKPMKYVIGTLTISILLGATVITLAGLSDYKIPFVASLFSLGVVSYLLVCEVVRKHD